MFINWKVKLSIFSKFFYTLNTIPILSHFLLEIVSTTAFLALVPKKRVQESSPAQQLQEGAAQGLGKTNRSNWNPPPSLSEMWSRRRTVISKPSTPERCGYLDKWKSRAWKGLRLFFLVSFSFFFSWFLFSFFSFFSLCFPFCSLCSYFFCL